MQTVSIDGREIPPAAIAAEMQYHPAPTQEHAWTEAARALAIRVLLLAEAVRLGIVAEPEDSEGEEEARIRALLAQHIRTPEPDAATCRRYWSANRARFRAPTVYEAGHILFPAAVDDETARAAAKRAAQETLVLLADAPERFAGLARERSACPSSESGGLLGQLCRGDLVGEIETFIMSMEVGRICPVPVASRYGFHVLRLDRRVEGADLPFEVAQPAVARHLMGRSWQRAVSQYLRILAGRARIEGLDLQAADSPLVQ